MEASTIEANQRLAYVLTFGEIEVIHVEASGIEVSNTAFISGNCIGADHGEQSMA